MKTTLRNRKQSQSLPSHYCSCSCHVNSQWFLTCIPFSIGFGFYSLHPTIFYLEKKLTEMATKGIKNIFFHWISKLLMFEEILSNFDFWPHPTLQPPTNINTGAIRMCLVWLWIWILLITLNKYYRRTHVLPQTKVDHYSQESLGITVSKI